MGHLINACGFRLGWTTVWSNYWGTQLHFGYSKFIFICARLRAYLRFFFHHKVIDKSSCLFSHFEIIKLLKYLNIKIYVYYNSIFDFLPSVYQLAYEQMRLTRKTYFIKILKNRLYASFLVSKNSKCIPKTSIKLNKILNDKFLISRISKGLTIKFKNKTILQTKKCLNLKKKFKHFFVYKLKSKLININKTKYLILAFIRNLNFLQILQSNINKICFIFFKKNKIIKCQQFNLLDINKLNFALIDEIHFIDWTNKKSINLFNKKIKFNLLNTTLLDSVNCPVLMTICLIFNIYKHFSKYYYRPNLVSSSFNFKPRFKKFPVLKMNIKLGDYLIFIKSYKKFITFFKKTGFQTFKRNWFFFKYMKKFSLNSKFLDYMNIFYDFLKNRNYRSKRSFKNRSYIKKAPIFTKKINNMVNSVENKLIYNVKAYLKRRNGILFFSKYKNNLRYRISTILKNNLLFFSNYFKNNTLYKDNIILIEKYPYYQLPKQYPKSLAGRWWPSETPNFQPSIDNKYNIEYYDCLWLYINDNQRDISILTGVEWLNIFQLKNLKQYIFKSTLNWRSNFWIKFNSIKINKIKLLILFKLVDCLNARERFMTIKIDNLIVDEKFSLDRLEFIDAILEKLYDRLFLSKEQRDIRKASITLDELIVACIYALRQLREVELAWRGKNSKVGAWIRELPQFCIKYIYRIYYLFWNKNKYIVKLKKLGQIFGYNYDISKKLSICKIPSINKSIYKLLYNKYKSSWFNKKRAIRWKFKDQCYFYAGLILFLNISGYKKSTLFDMRYFNILKNALNLFKISLIKKFFLLRSRSNGYLFLRTNMRQYFILSSLFLWTDIKMNEKIKVARGREKNSRQNFFSERISGILSDIMFERAIKPLAECFKLRLKEVFVDIVSFDYNVQFYLITNAQINAVFLSRYIAKNLANHHRLRSLLYPLKREFKVVGYETKKTVTDVLKNVSNNNLKQKIKIIWRLFLLIIIIYYEKFIKYYYMQASSKISLDLFSLMFWINKYLNSNIVRVNINIKLYNLQKLLIERRALFLLSFVQDTKFQMVTFGKFFNILNPKIFSMFTKWNIILSFIIQDLFITKYTLLSQNFWILKDFELNYIKFGAFQYKRFLNYNYNSVSYSLFTNYNKVNNLKIRWRHRKHEGSGFLGFKMRCSGRFSRRQRASAYWFTLGSVPFNTISSYIEYAAATVPLVNSAITIKVWIHKMKTTEVLYELPLF